MHGFYKNVEAFRKNLQIFTFFFFFMIASEFLLLHIKQISTKQIFLREAKSLF